MFIKKAMDILYGRTVQDVWLMKRNLKKDLLEKKKAEDRERYHSYLVKEGQVIDDGIELAKEELKKYINKKICCLINYNFINTYKIFK